MVIKWINTRQARHPFAGFLLQVLAAVEACYGFHLHTAYLRTYHNVVADALTRKDADEVIREAGLTTLPKPDEALQRFLDRGWQRRALVWAGQADADTSQALKLSDSRNPSPVPKQLLGPTVLKVQFIRLGALAEGYTAALLASGAQLLEGDQGLPWRVSRPGKPVLACVTLTAKDWKEPVELIAPGFEKRGINLVWADSRDRGTITEFSEALAKRGFSVQVRAVCGRSLQDQVWWKRWVVTATLTGERQFEWVTFDDEPCTPPLSGYPLEWLTEDSQLQADSWETGLLKIDSSRNLQVPFNDRQKGERLSGTPEGPSQGCMKGHATR